MMIAVYGVELVALGIGIALAFYVGQGSERRTRTTWLCIALLVASSVGLVLLNLAMINYEIPAGWIVAVVAAGLLVVGLIVLIGRDVKWKPVSLAALAGMLLMVLLMYVPLGMFGVGHELTLPIVMNRAEQIGAANGFTPLIAPDDEIRYDYGYSVDPLEGSPGGLGIEYLSSARRGMTYVVQERKGTGASVADLEDMVAEGANPLGGEDGEIPERATVIKKTVQGKPAVAVVYTFQPPGANKESASGKGGDTKVFAKAVLVFELDGVDVRMGNEAGEANPSADWTPESLADDLAATAETLEPVQ